MHNALPAMQVYCFTWVTVRNTGEAPGLGLAPFENKSNSFWSISTWKVGVSVNDKSGEKELPPISKVLPWLHWTFLSMASHMAIGCMGRLLQNTWWQTLLWITKLKLYFKTKPFGRISWEKPCLGVACSSFHGSYVLGSTNINIPSYVTSFHLSIPSHCPNWSPPHSNLLISTNTHTIPEQELNISKKWLIWKLGLFTWDNSFFLLGYHITS